MKKLYSIISFRVVLGFVAFILIGQDFTLYAQEDQRQTSVIQSEKKEKGIAGQIYDAKNKQPLPSRILIKNASEIFDGYFIHLPGFFTDDEGKFKCDNLPPGIYEGEVFCGNEYLPQKFFFTLEKDVGLQVKIFLTPWVNLKELGWVNGECHFHLYSHEPNNFGMLKLTRSIFLGQNIQFLCLCQTWAGFTEKNWNTYSPQFTDDRFILHFGAEMPKYRFGHTWWLGLNNTLDYFPNTMDTVYEDYFQGNVVSFNAKEAPFPYIPSVELVPRFRKHFDAVAVHAHPTSWWLEPVTVNEVTTKKYVTNVAIDAVFGLLAGKLSDGIAVLGYNVDHYFYQNLWFHFLNQGYRLDAFSETDAGIDKDSEHYPGRIKTYYHLDKSLNDRSFNIPEVVSASRKGHTFVSSGPLVFPLIDNLYQPGDIVPVDGSAHSLTINAYCSSDPSDFISYLVIFRNGAVEKIWDVRKDRPRNLEVTYEIKEQKRAWYVVKVYGKEAWTDSRDLDVMNYCQRKEEKLEPYSGKENNSKKHKVAISSPFYLWPKGTAEPEALISHVRLKIFSPEKNLEKVTVEIWVLGVKQAEYILENGEGNFEMPVHGLLKIKCEGFPSIYRGLFLDYPPYREIVDHLVSGKWWEEKYQDFFSPGEIPWKAFQFENSKKVLSEVDWNIELKTNERDDLWEKFNALFE